MRPRWRKLRADLGAMRGRVALMVIALAVSLAGLGTILGARAVLRRAIVESYRSGHPAEATLELPGGVDAAVLARVRADPAVAAADARDVVMARVQRGERWQPLQLFVADDVTALTLDRLAPARGAWPPPAGTLLLERSGVLILGADLGDELVIATPHGAPQPVAITGIVHDTGLAPAWMEHKGYGYVTRQTLAALGEPGVLHELRVRFAPEPRRQADAEAAALALADRLDAAGHRVAEVHVPALRRHPHQAQMDTVQLGLLAFSVLILVLSSVLVATLLAAMLARQVREIGVMKSVGARTGQLAAMYAGFVAVLGAAALLIAIPVAYLGAHAFVDTIARFLNLRVADPVIPAWVWLVLIAAGLGAPLAAAAVPILRACRVTVRQALDSHGAPEIVKRPRTWLPIAARNALRRPARLALILALLGVGGTTAMSALDLQQGYLGTSAAMSRMRHDDLEIAVAEPVPADVLRDAAAIPAVRAAEVWGSGRAELAPEGRAAGRFVDRAYPDGGHGTMAVYAPPADTALVTFPVVAGRWLAAGDTDAIVIPRALAGRTGGPGARITLSIDGALSTWTVVGVVDEIPPRAVYVAPDALARATGAPPGTGRMLRIATVDRSDDGVARASADIERRLAERGAAVTRVIPFALLRGAIDDHLLILVRGAVAIAALVALVGLIGLAAITGVGVLERTRELGVMKALGASDARVARLVVGEAVFIGAVAWLLSAAASLPLTYLLETVLARGGFMLPTFAISPLGMALWAVALLAGSAVATLLPARRAARLTVREAIAET